MNVRRALLGDPRTRRRVLAAVVAATTLTFLACAAYWRSSAAYHVGADTMGTTAVLALALAVAVQYYGDGLLLTVLAASGPTVASTLAHVAFGPLDTLDGSRLGFLTANLLTVAGLVLLLSALAVAAGHLLRRCTPPSDRRLSVRLFGPPECRPRALVTVLAFYAVAVLVGAQWVVGIRHSAGSFPEPMFPPMLPALLGGVVAAIVYYRWRALVLAWLAIPAHVAGFATASVLFGPFDSTLDGFAYFLDAEYVVFTLDAALVLGTFGALVGVGLRTVGATIGDDGPPGATTET